MTSDGLPWNCSFCIFFAPPENPKLYLCELLGMIALAIVLIELSQVLQPRMLLGKTWKIALTLPYRQRLNSNNR